MHRTWNGVSRVIHAGMHERVRRVAFALSMVITVAGTAATMDQLEHRRRQRLEAAQRLRPDTPLMDGVAGRSPRAGARLARLTIPSIDVDEVVLEGVGARQLAMGLGHYPRSAALGTIGVAAIAGHRTGWGDPLLRLDELGRGDRIVARTARERHVFRVTSSRVVAPSATWVLRGDTSRLDLAQLVITTCTPPYTSRSRLVVFAVIDQGAGTVPV